jgi:preprotein translocase subunit SecD
MLADAAQIAESGLAKFVNTTFNNPITLFGIGMALLILFFWYFATEVEKNKRNVGTVLLCGICGLCLLSIMPPKERLKGGIDIRGGSSFTLKIQPKEADDGKLQPVTAQQAEMAKKVIQKRLDNFGSKEAVIATQGEDSILVQISAVTPEESDAVRVILEKVAKLELREVCPRNEEVGADGKRSPSAPKRSLKSSLAIKFTTISTRTKMVTRSSPRCCLTGPLSAALTFIKRILPNNRRMRCRSCSTALAPTK